MRFKTGVEYVRNTEAIRSRYGGDMETIRSGYGENTGNGGRMLVSDQGESGIGQGAKRELSGLKLGQTSTRVELE